MKIKLAGFMFLLAVVFLAGCQEPITPEERLGEYVSHWNDEAFDVMYEEYATTKSKETFKTDEMVDYWSKVYQDIEVSSLEVSMQDIPEDTEWAEDEPAEIGVDVSFETMAGPVSFEKQVTLIQEEREEEVNWYVDWAPSFIFAEYEQNDSIDISTVPGVRGELHDRNGNPLAINGSGYQVGVVPGELTDEAKSTLAEELSISVEAIDGELSQAWVEDDLFVPLKKVSGTQQEKVSAITELPGVYSQSVGMREYPFGEVVSHLTGYIGPVTAEDLEELEGEGYTSTDMIGRRGLEQLLEDRLRAESGASIAIVKEDDTITVAEKEAQDGETIKLTIDADLQRTAFEAMEGQPGTAAAVDPETGETLVLASSPGFDPAELALGISGERRAELEEDPGDPLTNRFSTAYAPGSTQKTLTAAIGMEADTLDPAEGFTIDGGLTWQKEGWGDFRVTRVHETPNPVNLNKGLVFSDNIYFAMVALDMGSETLIDGLESLGYEEEMPFTYPMRVSQISNDGTIGSEGQLVDTSYGQGEMLTNILHLASMYEIVLTDGTMMKPLLLEEEEPEVWKEGLLSAENASILRTDLRDVVTEGFAQPANIEEVSIAGKTGTAELKLAGEESGKENGFFVAYDENNPEFVLAMMIEGVEDLGGSTYVSELATEVFLNR
ncbi:penicillin-binding transpeptidase domain-containing protein [Jeotgalibacillus salarius]|uniref:Penicillin-binding transpeptidase domain-containing protein n=1 Tax=Jeotgalibacillus salarius TaxID=546023 RepID=A0A4Y8LCZ9_9BACL|nr:penicillin-binding transpeptidase domain-containing protein [Jeotgalibacillus salarius]TFE00554.1 penicillin-binding transpeptidase domain-containing protein [Jeotgalibacillus salarius]